LGYVLSYHQLVRVESACTLLIALLHVENNALYLCSFIAEPTLHENVVDTNQFHHTHHLEVYYFERDNSHKFVAIMLYNFMAYSSAKLLHQFISPVNGKNMSYSSKMIFVNCIGYIRYWVNSELGDFAMKTG
jgi:hypothetical protein